MQLFSFNFYPLCTVLFSTPLFKCRKNHEKGYSSYGNFLKWQMGTIISVQTWLASNVRKNSKENFSLVKKSKKFLCRRGPAAAGGSIETHFMQSLFKMKLARLESEPWLHLFFQFETHFESFRKKSDKSFHEDSSEWNLEYILDKWCGGA